MLAMTGFIGWGPVETARAEISPLITSYKPQVVNADVEASYTDADGNTITATIHHPGIVMRQADLDNMRDHVRAGDEPWNTAFNAFASDSQSSKNPRKYYEEGNDIFVNILGPWATDDYNNPSEYVGSRGNTDAETAFKQAIMWYITGDETYRSNAMYIIRAYAGIQSCALHTNFRFATITYLLGAAAEILRYSDTPTESLKWTATDTQNLSNMMDYLWNAYSERYPDFHMNQHQFTVMGKIGRGIFKNDLQMYVEAVEATTVNAQGNDGGRNGSIKHQMRLMTKNEMTGEPLDPSDVHVQLIEMGRDQGHAYDNVGGLSTLAQTIYAQGTKLDPVTGAMSTDANAVNIFNFLDDRLLEGTSYLLKYNLGYDVLWTPAWANHGSVQYYESINPWPGRGRLEPHLSVLYNYYKYIEQQDMTQEKYKYLAYAYNTRMPEVAGEDYPLATLLYTPDAAKADGLSNKITLGSITGLTATMAGSDTINLSWTAVSGALGYNIYRSTEENGTYIKLNSAPITGTSYSSTGLTPNTIYYYKVGVAGGSTSGVVSATTGGTGIPAFDVSNYDLNVNHTHQSILRVIHPDRSSQDLTSQASFTSSDPAVATVDSAGLVTGIGVGTATITATYNGQAYNATVKVIIDTDLNTWYKMDETSGATAADASGHGNTGTINGGAAWTTGQSGNAADLDGTDDYIALPEVVVSGADTITVAAWVNLDTASNWMRIFDFGSGTSTYMFLTPKNGSNGNIRFGIKNNNSSTQIIDGTSALATGGWHHVAVTLNGSTGTLYVDGAFVNSNTSMTIKPSDMGATTQNWIGRSQYSDPYLDGRVDDFRIYNRAISSSEVVSVMNGQTLETVTAAPVGVTATTAEHSSINLSWSAVTGAAGYNVYVADSLAENAIYTKVNSDLITGTSYASLGLKANKTYYYKVTAVNDVGESAVSATVSATTAYLQDSSLIAWYKFDETSGTTAADSSGHGNNGTLGGGANTTWTTGKYGNAVNFGGVNTDATYVTLPGNLVDNMSSMTFTAWVNSSNTSDYTSLFTAAPSAASSPTKYMMFQPRGSRFMITNGGASGEQNMSPGSNLTANTWKHIAITLSGNTGILFIDGAEVARNENMTLKPSDLAPTTSGNFIGKSAWTGDKYVKGQVDDVRIYKRAISASEVASVMNGDMLPGNLFTANQDIGTVGNTGSSSYNGSQYVVEGSGTDIWGTSDQFQYDYVHMTGDQTITVRVNSLTNTNAWAKAGLMFRESLSPDAKNVFVAMTPGNGATFQYRSSTGGTTSNVVSSGKTAPYWLKLVRSGSLFTGYTSPDGTNWTLLGSTAFTMSSTAYIGLAVTSHDNTKLSTASFDNVTIQQITSGATYKLKARHSDKLAGVSGDSTENGAYVVQQTDTGSTAQLWTITALGNGYYKIINVNSGKSLDVSGGSTANGAKLIQWPYSGSDHEQWQIIDLANGAYKLIARHSGKAMDVPGGSTADGASIQQWTDTGGNNQQWHLIKQ
ncbi:LamG-like jellyroll fold domain-containing protein [Paenibacillus tarimensis]